MGNLMVVEKVRHDVYDVMNRVAERFNVDMYQLPTVYVSDEGKNSDASCGWITIHPMHIGDHKTYAEEATHFLRCYFSNGQDLVIQEFFGGLARLMFSQRDIEDEIRRTMETAILLASIGIANPTDEQNFRSLASVCGHLIACGVYRQGLDRFLYEYPDMIKKSDVDVRKILRIERR